jgi:kinesin family member 2/24
MEFKNSKTTVSKSGVQASTRPSTAKTPAGYGELKESPFEAVKCKCRFKQVEKPKGVSKKEQLIDAMTAEQVLNELKEKRLPTFGTHGEKRDRLKKHLGIESQDMVP